MTEIQNLLERAKPELLKAIAVYGVEYPNTADSVKRVLTNSTFVTEIPFGTLNALDSICRLYGIEFKFHNPYTLFDDLARVIHR